MMMTVKMAAASSKTKVVLLSCGCFNPITHMHLRMFELARDALHKTGIFDVIGGIISPVNDSYGKKDLISSNHRIEMLKLATRTSDWLKIDDWECKQEEWKRTSLVLDHAREQILKGAAPYNSFHLNGSSVKIKLLCGADLLESFAVPNLWSDDDMATIAGDFGMCVITREGSNPKSFISKLDWPSERKNSIHIITEWIHNEISATKIRTALRNGDSVKYLLPDSVLEYIKENNLYES